MYYIIRPTNMIISFIRNIKQLRDVLSKPIKRNTSQSYERKVKYLYQQCVHDYERQKEVGILNVAVFSSFEI